MGTAVAYFRVELASTRVRTTKWMWQSHWHFSEKMSAYFIVALVRFVEICDPLDEEKKGKEIGKKENISNFSWAGNDVINLFRDSYALSATKTTWRSPEPSTFPERKENEAVEWKPIRKIAIASWALDQRCACSLHCTADRKHTIYPNDVHSNRVSTNIYNAHRNVSAGCKLADMFSLRLRDESTHFISPRPPPVQHINVIAPIRLISLTCLCAKWLMARVCVCVLRTWPHEVRWWKSQRKKSLR